MNLRIMVPKGRNFDNDGATIYARRGGGLAARGTLTARSWKISNAQALDHLKIQRLMSSHNDAHSAAPPYGFSAKSTPRSGIGHAIGGAANDGDAKDGKATRIRTVPLWGFGTRPRFRGQGSRQDQ